jgi:hypothetical protein
LPPNRLLIRRQKAASGDRVRRSAWAAIRRATATRFFPFRGGRLPFVLLLSACRGQTPS